MRKLIGLLTVWILAIACDSTKTHDHPEVVEQETVGLVEGEGLIIVKANCTGCHSEKLIVQNRATREGWLSMIRWMQASQNLWDLGENEQVILDYLEANYAPEKKGRRASLVETEWYELK